MDAIPTDPTLSEQDWHSFHALAVLAAHGKPVDDILIALRDHFGALSADIYPPDAPAPDGSRLIMAPLHHRGRYLGDLVLDVPAQTNSTTLAARLSFFVPIITLALVTDANQAPLAENHRALLAVQEERDRLESVLEATNEAIVLINSEGIVELVTLQFETFTGIPRYHILGQHSDVLVQQIEQQAGLPSGMANLLRALLDNHSESLGGELEIGEPQRRILVWYSLPVYAQSGLLLGRIFAFRDATRERDADRLKTEFVHLVSHELRTPLTSVKGFSDLILESELSGLDADTREYLQIISQNANRLIELINDILDITRIDMDRIVLKPALCRLPQVIEQAAAHVQTALEQHQHTLILDLEPNLPPVWADQGRLVQIVVNLLSNAIKYTLEPGPITVSARYIAQLSDLPYAPPHMPILPCVLVAVTDQGLGIAPEEQKNLFKRFYRAESNRQSGGIGLGLTLAKSFVEMHGGQVWVKSALGEGSTFYFTVPVVEGKTAAGVV